MASTFTDKETGEVVALGMVNMTNDDYHASIGVSKSHLDYVAANSLRKYWYKYRAPLDQRIVEETTPAKVMGSGIHCAILQPDLFRKQYVANPGIDRRSNAGKAEWQVFVAEHKGKTILSDDDFQTCLAIRDAVHRDPVARGLLHGCIFEQPVFAVDPETGELIKCQIDALHEGGSHIVDLKSTDDASPAGFARSAANYRYPLQPPWYLDVLDAAFGEYPENWVFMAVEKDPPHEIGLYFAQPEDIQRGRLAARRDFMRIVEASRANAWPSYSTEVLPLTLPTWWRP